MIKSLLTSVALCATVLTANAQTEQLPLDDLGSGWNSSYDPATKTITYDAAWSGKGWWLIDKDCSAYDEVVVEFEPSEIAVKIVIEYNGEGIASSETALAAVGSESVTCTLNPEGSASVKQVYIQCGNDPGTLTLTNAYFQSAISYTEIPVEYSGQSLASSAWSQYPDDAIMRFTIANNSGESRSGWGIGKIFAMGNWNGTENSNNVGGFELTGGAGDEFSIDLTVAKLNTLCIGAKDGVEKDFGGVTWNIYNDCALKSITALVPDDVEIDENLLWEGSWTAANFSGLGTSVQTSKLKAGDVIEYTMSDVKADGQLLIKDSSWKTVLGTAKINASDVVDGKVQVGITEELLAAAGSELKLQGDGMTVVEIRLLEDVTFDPADVLVWGDRAKDASIFVNLEGVPYLNVTVSGTPTYMNLCDNSWTPLAIPANRIINKDETVTYQYEVTSEIVAASQLLDSYNNNLGLIINNDVPVLSVSVADELVLPYDPEKLKLVPNTEGYNLSEQSIAEPMSDLEGFGPESELYILLETRAVGVDEILLNFGWSSTELVEEVTWMPYGVNFLKYDLDKEMYDNLVKNGIWIDGKDLTVKGVYYTVDETLGIDNIAVDENAPVEFYNLQGIKVSADDATNGIFIRRQGGKSTKVIR